LDYDHTDTALDGQGSRAAIDSYSPGLFAAYADGGWFANALASYSRNEYTEQRHVAIGTFEERANGAPTGGQELVNLDGGDSFIENGGCSSNLAVGNERADSLRSRLGGRVQYAIKDTASHVVFTPYLNASWQHEFLNGHRDITASFAELGGGSFTVVTPRASTDSVLMAIGLDADISGQVTLFASYLVQAGAEDYFGQSVEAGTKIAF